ncbi:MAG: hypothetical protein ACTHMD_05090 [Flavisolibacter sp.]
MKYRFFYAIILLAFACASNTAWAQNGHSKSPLKVLFVGYDPSKPLPEFSRSYPGMMSKEQFIAEYPVRMPAFKTLLSDYFAEVRTMDCRDWKPADSDPFDVTIFDFKTTPLEEARTEQGANGETKYIPAKYLPDNFSKPVVFIASTADEMGRAIGLKLDWLCLCLDADAHHVNLHHPIFRGPLEQVTPTMEMKKTPDGIYHYTTGDTVPKEIPMWRVQQVGYLDSKDVRIGLVSRGNRFAESPDAEIISSGVCAKDVGAVALGRHGNFFLWGFSASPAQMTDEAKKVFVNAVAYIKQFDGKTPIARKYNDRMATTDDVREIVANTSRKSYEEYVKEIEAFNAQNVKEKKRIDDKKAAGLQLTSSEETSLQYLGHEQKIETWEQYLKQIMGKFAAQFGTNAAGFQKYMTDNFGYLYCDPDKFFDYSIDEDVRRIGISNHDVKLLEKCIDMLKNNKQPDLALRVLKRYTAENFATANEWRSWFLKNKSKLFFTETDGYKFMVNTYNR